MNSSFSIDLNEDQNHNLDHFSPLSSKITEDNYASSSSNSISYPFFSITPSPQHFPYYRSHLLHPLHHQDEVENVYASSNNVSLDLPSIENENGNKFSVCKEEGRESSSVKWMSSKMRLMRKMMMKSDQMVGNSSNSHHKFEVKKGRSSYLELEDNTAKNLANNTIRVCADCNTTKTPLWRSGPRGPKSLCNACGIRQRKARRALAAAQESGSKTTFDATNSSSMKSKVHNKVFKNSNSTSTTTANNNDNNSHLPFKKRCKFTAQTRGKNDKKLRFEDLSSVILSKNNAAFQQVFPQDEKEAAILLMALSYGLVRG